MLSVSTVVKISH